MIITDGNFSSIIFINSVRVSRHLPLPNDDGSPSRWGSAREHRNPADISLAKSITSTPPTIITSSRGGSGDSEGENKGLNGGLNKGKGRDIDNSDKNGGPGDPDDPNSPPLAGDRDESPPTEIIFHVTSELYQNQDDNQKFENIAMGATMTIKVNFIATIMLLIKFKLNLVELVDDHSKFR